jgi:uncharacterized delta-60 repeat protein
MIDDEGRLLLAGRKGDDMAVVRLLASGSADTLFDDAHDGHEIVNFGSGDYAYSIDVDSQGRIVIGGETSSGGAASIAVARLTAAGALDTTFGTGGKVLTGVMDRSAYVRNISADDADRIMAAGGARVGGDTLYGGDGGPAVVLARFTESGELDTTFAAGGVDLYAFPQSNLYDAIASTVISADGQTYMGGAFEDETGWHAAIWGYAPQNTVTVYTVPPVSIAMASTDPASPLAGVDLHR